MLPDLRSACFFLSPPFSICFVLLRCVSPLIVDYLRRSNGFGVPRFCSGLDYFLAFASACVLA